MSFQLQVPIVDVLAISSKEKQGGPMEEHTFDELAKRLAEQTMTRGRALKLTGATILGAIGLVSLPKRAEAKKKKKKKKHHHRAPSTLPTPSVCSAGNAAACNPCGTSSTSGHPCECTTDIIGNPVCFDTQSGGQPCTSNVQCQAEGKLCLNQEPCGGAPGFFECQSPCS